MRQPLHGDRQNGCSGAFTLVELLVALAILSLLVLMLSQIVMLTGQAIAVSSRKLDAAAQARLVFDRIGADFAARPRRPDLGGMLFTKAVGNDSFQFYSEVTGYNAKRQISLVSYRVSAAPPGASQTSDGSLCLERGADGMLWTGSAPVFLPPVSLTQPATPTPVESNYDVLANGIFRLEFCYLLNTGALSLSPGGASNTDYSNVVGIVAAVAVLDARSGGLLTPAQIATLSSSLNDCTEGSDPISVWNGQFNSSFVPGLPRQAVQNVRFYQRTFYVH